MEVDLTRLGEVAIPIWPVAVSFLGGYGVTRWEWGCTGGNTVKSQDGITVENQRWNYSEKTRGRSLMHRWSCSENPKMY